MAEPYACQSVTYFSVTSNGEGDPPEVRFECDGGPAGDCGWSVDIDGLPVGFGSSTWQDMERRHAAHSIHLALRRHYPQQNAPSDRAS